ncbi:hypothetical protein BMH25_03785 [Leucobacter sp. OLCALW19]|nr:hypothetical protein BMH25_03785 [Leucobacter sp. OLCALW19]PII96847.1 hypothetical protein BMH28_14325 [Leucobacter sp. OLCS4]
MEAQNSVPRSPSLIQTDLISQVLLAIESMLLPVVLDDEPTCAIDQIESPDPSPVRVEDVGLHLEVVEAQPCQLEVEQALHP